MPARVVKAEALAGSNATLESLFNGATLVVAHPDDEVLWFGSVVNRVAELVVCFEGVGNQAVAEGRRRVAERFPRPVSWLRLDEPGTFGQVPWSSPQYSSFGLLTSDPRVNERCAMAFSKLSEVLRGALRNTRVVFTHNPWGEYGHADHTLVHAAVLQAVREREVTVVCPLIASLTSARAVKAQRRAWGPPLVGRVDVDFCKKARALYIENRVWTWFEDWEFPAEEHFSTLVAGGGAVREEDLRWVPGPEDYQYDAHMDEVDLSRLTALWHISTSSYHVDSALGWFQNVGGETEWCVSDDPGDALLRVFDVVQELEASRWDDLVAGAAAQLEKEGWHFTADDLSATLVELARVQVLLPNFWKTPNALSELEDRRVLERRIFPALRALPGSKKVLSAGCAWYTTHHEWLLGPTVELYTIDIDPSLAPFGAEHHVTDSLHRAELHWKPSTFDAVLCNGVYGWGLDKPEEIEAAFHACWKLLKPGGIFVLGWNDLPERRPISLVESAALSTFEPCSFAGLSPRHECVGAVKHRFWLFKRPL